MIWIDAIAWGALVVVLIVYEKLRQHLSLWYMALSLAITGIITQLIKMATAIPRPNLDSVWCPTDFTFPSMHSSLAFAAATVLSSVDRKKAWLYYSIAIVIAYSRVYVHCHYVSDVFIGALLGYCVAAITGRIVHSRTTASSNRHASSPQPDDASSP